MNKLVIVALAFILTIMIDTLAKQALIKHLEKSDQSLSLK